MKNTIKLILIIFFSIMYSQDIDLTGTKWTLTDPELVYKSKYVWNGMTFKFKKDHYFYCNGGGNIYMSGEWETVGNLFFIRIDWYRLEGDELKEDAVTRYGGAGLEVLSGSIDPENDSVYVINYDIKEILLTSPKVTIKRSSHPKNKLTILKFKLKKSSKKYNQSKLEFINNVKNKLATLHPNVFLPQDEFETDKEYAQRVNIQEKTMSEYIDDQNKISLSRHITTQNKNQVDLNAQIAQLNAQIAQSRKQVELPIIEIGQYNSENETFPITIELTSRNKPLTKRFIHITRVSDVDEFKKETSYTINIPRTEARSFKQNILSEKVKGYKQLNNDLDDYEFFNLVAIHPITGSRFPFGPTKNLDSAPLIASQKAFVPPNLSMKLAFIEPNSNGFLDAEEKGRVKVSITNSGQGSAMGVFVDLKAESKTDGVSFDNSKIIGEIQPGTTKTAEFEITASKKVQRSENIFTISATESYGFPPDPMQISFETYPFIPPKLEMVDYGISTATGDNVIKTGVVTEVQARVQNTGQGEAENVKFSINLPSGVYPTPDSKSSYTFSLLKPGEFKDLEFEFTPSQNVGKTIEISIGYTEESTTGKFPLSLEVEKPQKTIQQLVVSGKELVNVEIKDVTTISVDVEKDIPITKQESKNDLAVIFGIESYKNVPGVSFAKRDAVWMKSYFEKVLGIPSNKIYYKTDSDVGQAEFSKVFSEDGWLDKRIKEGKSNVYIYYAGHGAPDMKKNKAYLIPYDGDPNYASQTGYEMDVLYDNLGQMGAKSVTIFLDACFSGANRNNEMLLADARPVFIEVEASAAGNVTVFSAAGGKEISSAWPEKKHGLFTYFLMKGMKGEADTNGDKKLTVGELGDYIHENVSDMAGMLDREQTPGLETLDKNRVLVQY